MTDFVEVRGVEYPVERFTDAHLQMITKMLVQDGRGHFEIGSFSVQSESAEVVLEVMVPTLPEDVISVSPRGKYVWQLGQVEIPVLLMKLLRIWRSRQLAIAKARKDVTAIKAHEESLASIEAYLDEFGDLADISEDSPQPDLESAELAGDSTIAEISKAAHSSIAEMAKLARQDEEQELAQAKQVDRVAELERELAELRGRTGTEEPQAEEKGVEVFW